MPTGSDRFGVPIPNLPHAISVSLPTWEDHVRWAERNKKALDEMISGYPRYFIHRDVQALARVCEQKFGHPGEKCFLFPAAYIANAFQQFMTNRSPDPASPIPVRLVQYRICPGECENQTTFTYTPDKSNASVVMLYVVLFPEDAFSLGKQFWQHTGLGISSRQASSAFSLLAQSGESVPLAPTISPLASESQTFQHTQHYYTKNRLGPTLQLPECFLQPLITESIGSKHETGIKECYERNLSKESVALAKTVLRRRIAGALVSNWPAIHPPDKAPEPGVGRRTLYVTEDEVFLFPAGMAAIWISYQLILAIRPQHKSVCFGFPFSDTLKVFQKWGPGCHFFARGQDDDINELNSILQVESISALYTEFPSNPFLRSINLLKLRELANKHNFPIIIDDTIGSFANVEVLPYADIVVSSLSKVFSGAGNAMGGSLVLNPHGKHYEALKSQLQRIYEDTYWGEDAIFMERNSRDFVSRVHAINQNTEALCELFHNRSLSAPSPARSTVIKQVYYPKWETRANYDICRRTSNGNTYTGGFGGLFSITFTTASAARVFFDNLDCAKGPSFGTNFTLVCLYTFLTHYAELEWAEAYGIELELVKVSVGLEEREDLLSRFTVALDRAEATADQT
ncbi:pyridoxal phosphate-dependent transferase [Rhizoctonia solani]|nr:pyridoxal phosphate-dependent transferase [Rhizoctonia solani]